MTVIFNASDSRSARTRKLNEMAAQSGQAAQGGATAWGGITGTLASQSDLNSALAGKAGTGHNHDSAYASAVHTHSYDPAGTAAAAVSAHSAAADPHPGYLTPAEANAVYAPAHTHPYEPANANIQAHVASAHAPVNAQANADITKAEIEAKLTGTITSHTHAGGGGSTVLSARLTTNRTTTATGMANITDLAIPIGANETWNFEIELHAGCNNTGGSQFSVAVPAGATVKVRAVGNTNAAGTWSSGQISASDGASPTFLNVSAQGRQVNLKGVVINGATPGAIQGRFKSVTNGQTTTVEANSYITANKH